LLNTRAHVIAARNVHRVKCVRSFSTLHRITSKSNSTTRTTTSAAIRAPWATLARAVHNTAIPQQAAADGQPKGPMTETVRDFLPPDEFYNLLKRNGMDFYVGVPDSLLQSFLSYVMDVTPPSSHIITANEGSAVGVALGFHLATRKFPIVYMQNSGFGNAVNPLLSLADPRVYSIPMLLLIGYRGEPGKKDEPQHLVQGKCMSALLSDMNIQYEVLPDYLEGATASVEMARHYLERRSGPYAFLVRRQTFDPYVMKTVQKNVHTVTREEAVKIIVNNTKQFDIIIGSTGFLSRELYEYRAEKKQSHKHDFLTVGGMGHASAIALGVASRKSSRQVFCLDGDGAMLMHMGTVASIGQSGLDNFKHILINNGTHESVGGQPTGGFKVDFLTVAQGCGYKATFRASSADEIAEAVRKLREIDGPALLEIRVNQGTRNDLGRPKTTPIDNKKEFMHFLDG
jgi:phosphonopyruvate decarboxylase